MNIHRTDPGKIFEIKEVDKIIEIKEVNKSSSPISSKIVEVINLTFATEIKTKVDKKLSLMDRQDKSETSREKSSDKTEQISHNLLKSKSYEEANRRSETEKVKNVLNPVKKSDSSKQSQESRSQSASSSSSTSDDQWAEYDYDEDSPEVKNDVEDAQQIAQKALDKHRKAFLDAPEKRLNVLFKYLPKLPLSQQASVNQALLDLQTQMKAMNKTIQDKTDELGKKGFLNANTDVHDFIKKVTLPMIQKLEKLEDLFGSQLSPSLAEEIETIKLSAECLIFPMQNTSNDVVKFSRKTLDLTHSYLITPDGKILRYWHNKSKEMTQQLRTSREKGRIGEGGFKKVNKMEDLEGNFYARATFMDKKSDKLLESLIKNVKKFGHYPELCCGNYIKWKTAEDEEKTGFLAPYMKTDMHRLMITEQPSIPLSKETKLQAFIQIAKGLNIVHKEGSVHLDIKPDNVFVNFDETNHTIDAKLADFDLAQEVQDNEVILNTGAPIYMAPEVQKGTCQGFQAAKCADIFSLGLSFLEMLKGEHMSIDFMMTKTQNVDQLNYDVFSKEGFPEPQDKTSLEYLIWEMINPNQPEKRPSIQEVINRLENIYQKVNS